MKKTSKLEIRGTVVRVVKIGDEDCICVDESYRLRIAP